MNPRDNDLAALAPLLGDDWARRAAAERAEERARMIALRATLLAVARAAGAVTITARYEGGNDSGVIHEMAAEPEEADAALTRIAIHTPQQVYDRDACAYVTRLAPVGFMEAAKDFIGWMVTEHNGNWWDGSIETSGEVTWHVADEPDRIAGEHNVVVRNAEWSEWEDAPEEPDDGAAQAAADATPDGAADADAAADTAREG
jgi:hypothetical protein